ncbi:helix-turn-helix transcriptional regulator [Pedobacter sp. PAMC26386]|nr:helix-turn-helix transcriptional regulator [Pedobacter sp. PAMC26386]
MANVLLALAFLSIGAYALNHFLFITHIILDIPIYYRIAKPFYYLIPPCIYLYILLISSADKPRFFWWHFLPAALMVLDTIPWIIIGSKARYEIVNSILKDPALVFETIHNIFPVWIHSVIRPVQGIIYICYLVIHLQKMKDDEKYQLDTARYKSYYQWALVLVFSESAMYFSLTCHTIINFMNINNAGLFTLTGYLPAMSMCVSFIFLCSYVYTHPSLTCGYTPQIKETAVDDLLISYSKSVYPIFNAETLLVYQRCLEIELRDNYMFKQKGLTFQQLAKYCRVPKNAFSFLLANVYSKHFNNYINDYRICYIVERLYSPEWKELTLEGLAHEAGFSSRTTFFIAFKKKMGVSPTSYLKKLNKQ